MMKSLLILCAAGALVVADTADVAAQPTSPPPSSPPPDSEFGYRARVRAAAALDLAPPAGWYVGLGMHTARFSHQTGGPEQLGSGGGASLFAGLHLSPRATLEVGWTESLHNPLDVETIYGTEVDYLVLDSWTLGTRLYLTGMDRAVNPYLQIGVGLYALSSEHSGLDSTGTGFHIGIGADVWLTDYLTLGGRLRRRSISMGPPNELYNDTHLTTTLFEVSVALHL